MDYVFRLALAEIGKGADCRAFVIEVKSCVIFMKHSGCTTVRFKEKRSVIEHVQNLCVDLRGADLRGADLRGKSSCLSGDPVSAVYANFH